MFVCYPKKGGNRLLKMTPSVVLSRSSPYNVPQGYASVSELPAALLGCHFEQPVGMLSRCVTSTL